MTIEYKDSKRIETTVNTDADYKVHSFTSSGTFAVTGSGDVEYLVVAGGGGGAHGGGGAGAGGYLTSTGHGVTAQSYTITVGTGGTGSSSTANGGAGTASSFSTITSTGGGGGGKVNTAGQSGGSGGGAGGNGGASSGGSPTAGQGFIGGGTTGFLAPYSGSGGGGAGAKGDEAPSAYVGSDGGAGLSSSITGSAVFYSGGGGGGVYQANASNVGGAGGSSIGGAGCGTSGCTAGNGTINTGSGGGGAEGSAGLGGTGGNGGSGIVIIRYLTSSSITATGGTITTISAPAPTIKPTNVQDNSILVEKDTANRYWFSEALAPTYGGNDITTDITWTQTIGSSTSDTFYILKDTGNDLMDIKAAGNCGTFANPSIGYATLGSTLSSSSWIVRFKLVFNTVTAESTGGKSFLTTFGVVDTATDWQDSENGFIFRFIADSGSAQTQFGSVTSGTVSTTSMSWTPATNNTIYVQIAYSSGTATANFYSDPEFLTGVGTANVTRSGTFSGIRYPQIAFLQDTGGNGVMEIDMKDLKIYNGVTSITPATWNIEHGMVVWTVDQNFSSSTGWTKTPSNTSYWSIASDKLSWDCRIASTGQGYNYDLTTGQSVSNLDSYDEWLLRFEIVVTGGTNLNNDCVTTFGISSKDDFTSGTGAQYTSSRSQIRLQCAVLDPNGNTRTLQMQAQVGTHMGQQTTPNIAFSNNTIYYVEIKKTGATSYTVSWTSNSDYVTSTNSKDFTGLTLTGLKYLHTESWLQGSQTQYESRSQGYIDNLKFYAGVSSV